MTGRRRQIEWALLAFVLSGTVVAACSGHLNDSSSAKFDQVGSRIDGGAGTSAKSQPPSAQTLSSRARKPAVGEQTSARKVIYTGSMAVQVKDASAAAVQARGIAEDNGGYLASQNADLTGTKLVSVPLRVRADKFDEA